MDKDKQIYPLTARILRPLRWEMNCIQVEIKGERSSIMKVAGIIAEYNQFHKGHHNHIEETRKNNENYSVQKTLHFATRLDRRNRLSRGTV